MSQDVNDQLVLIGGKSTTGKSASLRNLRNQERVLYMNCEAGKRLPFRNNFESVTITDPYQVYEGFDYAQSNPNFDVVVVDTLTFLMDMFESMYIVGAKDTMAGWANYAQFFKNMMQDKVASSDKQVIFTAHTLDILNKEEMAMETHVPVKGALKNNGLEAYFSTVVATKKTPLKSLKEGTFDGDLLHISPEDQSLKYKHTFQTRLTADTVGERIRSPMGMFDINQTFIDNDAQLLLDHLQEYYG